MASYIERLGYVISANGRDAIREFRSVRDSAKRDLGGAETMLGRFNANAAGVGSGLKGFAAGILASAGIGAVGEMTDAASQLEQSAGAIESVFGDAKVAIEDFGESAAQTAGLSKREVNEMASVIGAQLQGMGFSAEESAQQIILLQKRAADMAATFGGSTRQAIEAISSALRKERDPIEQYGVAIQEADVKSRIAALNLDSTTVASQKYSNAVATLDLILQGTAKTQGQFNRELDTAAGAQARAAAEYENAKARLGEALLPLQTGVTNFAGHFVRGSSMTVNAVTDMVGGLWDLVDGSDKAAASQEANAEAIGQVRDAAEEARVSVEEYASALTELQDEAFGVQEAQDNATSSLLDLVDMATEADRKRAQSADRLADTIKRANDRIRDAEKSVRDAREDAGKVNVPGRERDAANERLQEAEERLTEVRGEAQESIDAARATADEFDRWTPALDRATTAGIKNRDVLRDHVDAVFKTAEKMLEEGATAQEINGYLRTQRDLLAETANKVGFARSEMQEFLNLFNQAQGLVPNKPTLPTVGGVTGPWSPEKVASTPQLPFLNGVQGPWSPVIIQTGYIDDPAKLAEIVGREVSRQLRRRG